MRESDITVEYNHVLRSISRGSFFSFIYMLLFCSEVLCFVFEPAACKYWEKKQSLKIKQCHFSKGTKLLWIELNWNKECSFSVPNVKNKKKRKFHILFLREFCVLNCVYVVRRMVFVCTKKHIFQWVSDYICLTFDRRNMLTTFNGVYAILVRFSSLIRFHLIKRNLKCYIDRCTSLDLLFRVSLGQSSKVSHIGPKFQRKLKMSAKCYFLFFGKFMCQFRHLLHEYPSFLSDQTLQSSRIRHLIA